MVLIKRPETLVFNAFQSSNVGQPSSPEIFLHIVEVLYDALAMQDSAAVDASTRIGLSEGIATRIRYALCADEM